MKKILSLICVAVLFIAFTSEKKYGVSFTQAELIKIMNVVDKSTAPHNEVMEVQALWNRELKQHIDTTGRLK